MLKSAFPGWAAALLFGLLGLLGRPQVASATPLMPLSQAFKAALQAPDFSAAVQSLEASLEDLERLRFRKQYPISRGVSELTETFHPDTRAFHALDRCLTRVYRFLLEKHDDYELSGFDIWTLVRLKPGRKFADVLREFGPRSRPRSPPVALLAYLVSEKIPARDLLQAFEWVALAGHRGASEREERLLGPDINRLVETLPEPLRMEAARRVLYDIGWYLEADERYHQIGPEVTLAWIDRAFAALGDEEGLYFTVELLSRMGGLYPSNHAPIPRLRYASFQQVDLSVEFQVRLVARVPPTRLLELYAAMGHFMRHSKREEERLGEISNLVAAARHAGADAPTLTAFEEALGDIPEVPGEEHPQPTILDAVRRFAGWKVGREVTGYREEGAFGLVSRNRTQNFLGTKCTASYDLRQFRRGRWESIAVVRSACRSKDDFRIHFRLGWKLRALFL